LKQISLGVAPRKKMVTFMYKLQNHKSGLKLIIQRAWKARFNLALALLSVVAAVTSTTMANAQKRQ